MKRHHSQPGAASRRGTLMPALAMVILVVCVAAALILDRLWLDAARVELTTAAEAAALAAAGRLADDDRLRTDADGTAIIEAARFTAWSIAADNRVAGSVVEMDTSPDGDIRFGVVTDDPTTGVPVFLETDHNPTSVIVRAQAIRRRGNGVALFFRGLTGVETGNVVSFAEASINNRVIGFRSILRANVPAMPLGILESDVTGTRKDTWEWQIVQQNGQDLYGYDEASHFVTNGPDGIREIVLTYESSTSDVSTSEENGSQETSPNFQIIDTGNGLLEQQCRRQILEGWDEEDLAQFGGEFVLSSSSQPIDGSDSMFLECLSEFEQMIGHKRICVLYQDDSLANELGIGRLQATQFVAGRILAIDGAETGSTQIVFQPAVVSTRTAIIDETLSEDLANPYVFKLQLTH